MLEAHSTDGAGPSKPKDPCQNSFRHEICAAFAHDVPSLAYRCKDTQETVNFYRDILEMDFLLAISEDRVPSTKEPDPYVHVFLDAGHGNVLAFFELPNSPPMVSDPNTPSWVQHIAFKVKDMAALEHVDLDLLGGRLRNGNGCFQRDLFSGSAAPVLRFFLKH